MIDVSSFEWSKKCPFCGVEMVSFKDFQYESKSCSRVGAHDFEFRNTYRDFMFWTRQIGDFGFWGKEIDPKELDRILKLLAFK